MENQISKLDMCRMYDLAATILNAISQWGKDQGLQPTAVRGWACTHPLLHGAGCSPCH